MTVELVEQFANFGHFNDMNLSKIDQGLLIAKIFEIECETAPHSTLFF